MEAVIPKNYDDFIEKINDESIYLLRYDNTLFKIKNYKTGFERNYKVTLENLDEGTILNERKILENQDYLLDFDEQSWYANDLYDFVEKLDYRKVEVSCKKYLFVMMKIK